MDEKYLYNGYEYTKQEVEAAAQKKGLSFDAYVQQKGLKKKDGGILSSPSDSTQQPTTAVKPLQSPSAQRPESFLQTTIEVAGKRSPLAQGKNIPKPQVQEDVVEAENPNWREQLTGDLKRVESKLAAKPKETEVDIELGKTVKPKFDLLAETESRKAEERKQRQIDAVARDIVFDFASPDMMLDPEALNLSREKNVIKQLPILAERLNAGARSLGLPDLILPQDIESADGVKNAIDKANKFLDDQIYKSQIEISGTPVGQIAPGYNQSQRIDTDETIRLRELKEKYLGKILNPFLAIKTVSESPSSDHNAIGAKLLEYKDPVTSSKLKVNPNLQVPKYQAEQLGLDAKINYNLARIEEQGENRDLELFEQTNKLISRQKNAVYDYPDIRKQELRELVDERLAAKGEIGSMTGNDDYAQRLAEIRKLQTLPINPKDIPLLKQMEDDLDLGLQYKNRGVGLTLDKDGKTIIDDKTSVDRYVKATEEFTKWSDQSTLGRVGRALASPVTESAKLAFDYIPEAFKGDEKGRLERYEKEGLSGMTFRPGALAFQQAQVIMDADEKSETFGIKIANPDAGKYQMRNMWREAVDGSAQLVGQMVYGYGLGKLFQPIAGRFAGAVGEVGEWTGRAKAVNDFARVVMPGITMSWDGNAKDAYDMFGAGDENAAKRILYTSAASFVEGGAEKWGNPFEQIGMAKAALAGVKGSIFDVIKGLSIKEIKSLTAEQLQDKFYKAAKRVLVPLAKGAKQIQGETMEEEATTIAKFATAALLGANMEDRSLLDEMQNTAIQTFATMSIMGGVTAGGSLVTYRNSALTKNSIYHMGSDPDQYREAVQDLAQKGELTPEEVNEKMLLINTAEVARKNWDLVKDDVKRKKGLSHEQALQNGAQFVQARTNEMALQKEANKPNIAPVDKERLEKKIAKWQNVQRGILDGEVHFDEIGTPALPAFSVPNMTEVQAENELGEKETVFVPLDPKTGGVKPMQAPIQKVEGAETGEAAPELSTEITEPAAKPTRRLQGRLSRTKGTLPVTEESATKTEKEGYSYQGKKVAEMPDDLLIEIYEGLRQSDATDFKATEELGSEMRKRGIKWNDQTFKYESPKAAESAPDNKAEIAAAEQNLATKLANLAKWRDEQNAAIRQMYQDSPDPDAWVEPYNKLTEEYNAKIEEISAIAGQAYPKMAKAEPKPIVEAEAAEPMQLPKRNDDFVRKYMSEAEQEALSGKTPEQKAEIIEAKREEVLAAAPSVEVQPKAATKTYPELQEEVNDAMQEEEAAASKIEEHYKSKDVSQDAIDQLLVYGNKIGDFADIMPEAAKAYDPSIKELHDQNEAATNNRVGIESEVSKKIIDDISESFAKVGVASSAIKKVKAFFENFLKYGTFEQLGKKLKGNKFDDLKKDLVLQTYKEVAPEEFKGVDKYDDIPEAIRQKVEGKVDAAMQDFKQKFIESAAAPKEDTPQAETFDLTKVEYDQRYPKTSEIVFVSPDKLLERLAKDDPQYDVQDKKNQIGSRVQKAKDFILNYAKDNRWINAKTGERSKSTKVKFEPSIAQINNGKISFEDGRHRILAAKELGIKQVAVEVPKAQVQQFKNEFSESAAPAVSKPIQPTTKDQKPAAEKKVTGGVQPSTDSVGGGTAEGAVAVSKSDLKSVRPSKAKSKVAYDKDGIKIYETTDTDAFYNAIALASRLMQTDKGQLSKLSKEDYDSIVLAGGKLFLSEDGMFGGYVDVDGYMGSLFKNPISDKKKVSPILQDIRVKNGGRFFDAFATYLEDIYVKNGFRPFIRMKFNEDFAPDGWSDEKSTLKSKPDVVFFVYDPQGQYNIGDGVYSEDWDDAYKKSQNFNKDEKTNTKSVGRSEKSVEERVADGKNVSDKSGDGQEVRAGEGGIAERGNEGLRGEQGRSVEDKRTNVLEENRSADTQDFFTQVEEGKHRPKKALEFVLPLTNALKKVHDIWEKFKGYFDEHIETNIPAFRDIQLRKINAIAKLFPKGGRLIDLGGSTGAFGKAITIINPNISSVNLDANDKMMERHNTVPVKNSTFAKGAFLEGFDDIEAYVPDEKFDVVHESMLFQFITSDRGKFIDEIADNYLSDGGIVILEEKLDNPMFAQNEQKKDSDFKLKYYDQKYLDKKKDEVLVGMKSNQATQTQLENELKRRFKYVSQYWDGGNFKGYIASNNKGKVDAFLAEMGDTTTEFSSTEIAKAKDVPADGSIVDFKRNDDSGFFRYYMKDGKWHFIDTRGREQKEVQGKQQEITDYFVKVGGGKMYDVSSVMPIERTDEVERYIERATQVLTAIFPDAELVVYETEAEYLAAGGTPNTRGEWNPRNNQVSLNLERMRAENVAKTPIHEVIHPIVRAAIKSDPELENRLVSEIERFADVKGVDVVFAHANRYAGRPSYGEEVITEFYTRVADGTIDLNNVSKDIGDRIMDVWNAIADALAKVIPAAVNLKVKTVDELKNMASAIKLAFDKGDVSRVQKLLGTQRGAFYGVAMQEQADKRLDQLAPEFEQDLADLLEEFPDATFEEIMEEVEAETPQLVSTPQLRADTENRVRRAMNPEKTTLQKAIEKGLVAKSEKWIAKVKDELAKIFYTVFGLNDEKSQAAAEIADLTIRRIAELRGISVAEAYANIAYQQAEGGEQGALYQGFLEESDFDANGKPKPEVLAEIAAERAEIERKAKADGTWMKAPNGKKSNLNEGQWVTVRTKRFKDWFGDWQKDPKSASKVVDENGEPMVVYHGSKSQTKRYDDDPYQAEGEMPFYEFDSSKTSDFGFHFSPSKDVAIGMSKFYDESGWQHQGVVFETFLNIRNIQDVSDIEFWNPRKLRAEAKEYLPEWEYDYNKGFKENLSSAMNFPNGSIENVDGFRYWNEYEKPMVVRTEENKNDKAVTKLFFSYIAIEPNQVKSATSNIGTLSPQQGSILYQQEAWHGSPYAFDRFDLSKIGTGEGAQAFGYGLYFSDIEGIARDYAEKLGNIEAKVYANGKEIGYGHPLWDYQQFILRANGDAQSVLNELKDIQKAESGFPANARTKARQKAIAFLEKTPKIKIESNKNLYKVSLHKGKTPISSDKYEVFGNEIWAKKPPNMSDAEFAKKEMSGEIKPIKTFATKQEAENWLKEEDKKAEYDWLVWDKPLTAKQLSAINSQLAKEGFGETNTAKIFAHEDALTDNGSEAYRHLTNMYARQGDVNAAKEASLLLLRAGIDGVKYPAESIARGATTDTARGFNYVVFDENAVTIEERIQFQDQGLSAQGAIVMRGAAATIFAMTNPNVTTPLHEHAHAYFDALIWAGDNGNAQAAADVEVFAAQAGVTVSEIRSNPEAYTKAQELFARGFEKYLYDGVAPNKELQSLFDKFANWLREIYKTLAASPINVPLNDAMREVYGRMLTPQQVEKDFPKTTDINVNEKSVNLFAELQNAPPVKLGDMKNEFGAETMALAQLISKHFDAITDQLNKADIIKKDCK